ncbi:type II toxin-antitoxin system VapC family toxin [Gloeocapsopsis dulcis]|uniref:PIN domain-containing protein n=1 Tax=Gloeocapsopsis dulcis AAB1 = 1H9 TaxID=1433147 RepID=A0A6N8FMQ2_9CHRO|nr:hypothetical protein [Gloeocapsopsis dulcis]MUL34828.1 hypothetical protein [Gloeocapsopsis dulcis AAB1 = 1H9]WNN90103.1 hypothetical protein P0S91_03095 [Gloeocapsopsis dulcis]
MGGYIFDTNIFNQILDDKIELTYFVNIECFVTHVQHDEIQATSDTERRSQLEGVFSSVPQQEISTESCILGVSRLGQARMSDGNFCKQLKTQLDSIKTKLNNSQDALIAETAIANQLTLVTHDKNLYCVMAKFGGAACNLYHLIQLIQRA